MTSRLVGVVVSTEDLAKLPAHVYTICHGFYTPPPNCEYILVTQVTEPDGRQWIDWYGATASQRGR